MNLRISDMPIDTRHLPILHYSKIKMKSLPVTGSVPEPTLWKMINACLNDDGIGLAAPQIGIFSRVFVIRDRNENGELLDTFEIYINPSFTSNSPDKEAGQEACLSVPGGSKTVRRFTDITAKWFEKTLSGKLEEKTAVMTGFKARVFQHELDHLNAVSIVERAQS